VALEHDADGAFGGTAQARFGMGGHVLGQVLAVQWVWPAATRRLIWAR